MADDKSNLKGTRAAVGYRKPPIHSRFRKGQSGNPTGRRRQNDTERAKALIWQEFYRLIAVREGEKVTRMPALRAVLRSHVAAAAKGNVAAQRAVLQTIQAIEAEGRNPPRSQPANKNTKVLDDMTDEELMAFLKPTINSKPSEGT